MGKSYLGAVAALPLLLVGFWAPANALSVLYGVNSAGASDELLRIDTNTGASTIVGNIGFASVRGLAYDRVSDTLYGLDNSNDQLLTIDRNTGAGTVVGPVGGTFGNIQALTFDGSGTLYGADTSTNQLVTINTATGAATSVGGLGFSGVGGLAYDTNTDTLYGVSFITDLLYTINTSTGTGTSVGPLGFGGTVGLAFDESLGLFGADTSTETLFSIVASTGAGTGIGSLGVNAINGLTFVLPIPPAALLFGSALGLLGWMRRTTSS